MNQNKLKWYRKGTGIKVKIKGDLDEFGNQKIRPGIVIKSYPNHIKAQLFSTQFNKNDYYSIKINNKTCYIRSIYYKTVTANEIKSLWVERGKRIILDPNSSFFKKVAEMEYQEISGKSLNHEKQITFSSKEKHNEIEDIEYEN